MKIFKREQNTARRKHISPLRSCESTLSDYTTIADDIKDKNVELSKVLASVENELSIIIDDSTLF